MSEGGIDEAAWTDLRAALRQYVSAIVGLWHEPGYRYYSWSEKDRLRFTTVTKDAAGALPASKNPIRGSDQVEVDVAREEAAPEAWAAMRGQRPWLGETTDASLAAAERAVDSGREAVSVVLRRHPALSRRLYRLIWGRWPADADQDPLNLHQVMIDKFIGEEFEKKGWTVEAVRETKDLTEAELDELLALFRKDVERDFEVFYVIALLNGPPIDVDEPRIIWEGEWFGHKCALQVGYPSEETCTILLNDIFGKNYPPSDLHHVNAFVRFWYSVPIDEESNPHHTAREYVRKAIDLLRLLTTADVGVLHFHGRLVSHTFNIGTSFAWVFNDDRTPVQRVPTRRVYDVAADAPPFADTELNRLGTLFSDYAISGIRVLGMPVAMDRLRSAYERYSPDELGALVDTVTALEALFMSDGAKDELKFSLQVRISRLLESEPADRVRLAEEISKIYDLRSAIVHTGQPTTKLKAGAAELQKGAIRILRRSLLILLETDFAKGKNRKEMRTAWQLLALS